MLAMPSSITLATGPVSWGVDFADTSDNPPWRDVLDEIKLSGLRALELGPIGYLPEERKALKIELSSRSLRAVGTFLFHDLHDPSQTQDVFTLAARTCRAIAAADGTVLVLIDRPGPERAATAGRSRAARRLSEPEWRRMIGTIRQVDELASQYGLRSAVHPHAGGYIEFEDEIERLLMDCDLPLCLDTGHMLYAGLEPDAALAAYGERLAHLHLKDVDEAVLDRARSQQWNFWHAIGQGVFCPLGRGGVDLVAVAGGLGNVGYEGFATIEQDRVAGSGAPLDDLRTCIAALERAGIGTQHVANRAMK